MSPRHKAISLLLSVQETTKQQEAMKRNNKDKNKQIPRNNRNNKETKQHQKLNKKTKESSNTGYLLSKIQVPIKAASLTASSASLLPSPRPSAQKPPRTTIKTPMFSKNASNNNGNNKNTNRRTPPPTTHTKNNRTLTRRTLRTIRTRRKTPQRQ